MAVSKISDLLPISDNNTKPHAYEVFGLPGGESNPNIIRHAIDEMIAKVKAAKSQTEPALWKQVAGIVQAARVTLADSDKKSRLDAELGLASKPAAKPVDSKPVDPLAALLPPVNPMQSMESSPQAPKAKSPGPARTASGNNDPPGLATPMPPGLFSTPVVSEKPASPIREADAKSLPITPIPEPPASTTPTMVQPVIRDTPRFSNHRPTRRRKSIFVPIVMSIITLSLMAMVGLLAYALFFRKETIAISSSDGSVKISTSKNNSAEPRIRQPVASQTTASPVEQSPLQTPEKSQFPMRDETAFDTEMAPAMNEMKTKNPEPTPEMEEPEMMASKPSPPMVETPSVSPTKSDDEAAAKLAELRLAIRKGDWAGMTALAESINQMNLSPPQQTDAEGLLGVADLATFYRGGIERAVADLSAGDDFEVKNGFRVVVVGKTDQSLTVRYNTKTPEFTFDALPLSLAHRLATFQIPTGPSGDAAKAVYQAVAPKSTPGHREQAIAWLGEIDQPIEGADRDELLQTLQAIFDDK